MPIELIFEQFCAIAQRAEKSNCRRLSSGVVLFLGNMGNWRDPVPVNTQRCEGPNSIQYDKMYNSTHEPYASSIHSDNNGEK